MPTAAKRILATSISIALPILVVVASFVCVSCQNAPVTGRRQLMFVPKSNETEMGATTFNQIMKEEGESTNQHYIDMVNRAYDDYFLPKAKEDSVLVVESDDLDFVHDEEDLRNIENLLRQRLQMPPYQPGLPIKK